MTVETTEFKNHPAEYFEKIQATGESITIVAEKKPVALLIPLSAPINGAMTLMDRLLADPLSLKDFAPFSRAEIYDRK